MPVKTKKIHHNTPGDKHGHRRSKKFLHVYAPYIPLLMIVASGLFLSFSGEVKYGGRSNEVLGYAINTTDDGLLRATNEIRTEHGLSELKFNKKLDSAAQAKANDMAKRNYWSHNTPDGQEPWVFVDRAGYNYLRAAENLAYGFSSSDSTLSGWMNSPQHKANVLEGQTSEVGFGIVNTPDFNGSGPQTIVVAMYAEPLPNSNPQATEKLNDPLVLADQNEKQISYLQTLTSGRMPWLSFAVGLMMGGIGAYLIAKHTRRLHRTIKRGERFILHHPLLDITLVAILAVAAIATQTVGNIY